ncbi:Mpv17 / PMP22 family protein [Nitzschia inconspicua]|uniref:Mpv17 / PMP22 family protein n=1 Tax=Nitzschia inconspicua TaxID=303405 RepID=A0A9K3Q0X4_9STRA|nr:Mpv17 / PMP22 family protein [Nitzschia inconspicua]
MAFQSLHRGVLMKAGGSSAAIAVASITCFSTYLADRTSLELGRRTVVQTQQRFHHQFSALRQQVDKLCIKNDTSKLFSTTSNAKVEQEAVKKIEEAAAPATKASTKRSFAEFYEEHLEKNPLPTKMITGSFLWSVGDAVAQAVPPLAFGSDKPFVYDWARTGRCAFYGFFIHAPASHVHFNFLEYLTNRVGVTGLGIPVFKTVMEQFVYWSWVSNAMYHGFMGFVQGMTPTEIWKRLEDVMWDTQKAQWAFWIPVQLLNFQFVPVRHQLNVVLVTSVAWTALLSVWYPPLDEEIEGTEGKA